MVMAFKPRGTYHTGHLCKCMTLKVYLEAPDRKMIVAVNDAVSVQALEVEKLHTSI